MRVCPAYSRYGPALSNSVASPGAKSVSRIATLCCHDQPIRREAVDIRVYGRDRNMLQMDDDRRLPTLERYNEACVVAC